MSKKRYLVIIGIVVAAVALSILIHTMLVNRGPAIISLGAWPEKVLPLGSCQIVCHAIDPDDDELSYNWSASGGEITGEGATVNWTAPDSAGYYNVTVTVTDGRGGEVMNHVTITVGAPPVITSLVADRDWITPSGSVQVTCNATDPDGDELGYEWTATAGNISGAGAVVNWTSPQEVGIYHITVVVTDSQGGQDTGSIALVASNGTPPTIENLIVTAKGHIYLREGSKPGCDYDVWKAKEYDIECVVSDTSGEVSYVWSCDDGAISGEGAMITWTAPDRTLTRATVTVIVSDVAHNEMGKSIVFYVPSCTCGSWGQN